MEKKSYNGIKMEAIINDGKYKIMEMEFTKLDQFINLHYFWELKTKNCRILVNLKFVATKTNQCIGDSKGLNPDIFLLFKINL